MNVGVVSCLAKCEKNVRGVDGINKELHVPRNPYLTDLCCPVFLVCLLLL